MPLELLLVLVVGGIAGIAALLHLTGASARCDLSDEGRVRAAWARHFPGDAVLSVHPAPGVRAALVETAAGPGLVRAMGADAVAHRIRSAEPDARGLRLDFGDWGAPPVVVDLPPDMAADWRARIGNGQEDVAA